MGSSAKRKKEKKQDFQKTKLKVGKTKPKAANFTDTSFKAKSIVLTQQSISANAPTVAAQCAHHLGLLTHKSDNQRRDSLSYLTTAIATNLPGTPLPQPASVIIPAVQRLILDGTNSVRQQLLKLLQVLPKADIAGHSDQLLLHTRAGMTHLSTDIRIFALDVLEWLLSIAGDEVVSCAGGWVKMLKCFLGLLGWQSEVVGKWSAPKSFGKSGGDAKVQVKQMNALSSFLRAGLVPSQTTPQGSSGGQSFPLWQIEHHKLSDRSNAFAHLNLFGSARDEEAEMYEDREDRQRVFHDRAKAAVTVGLDIATKGGGELGRAAAQMRKVVREGMSDYHGEETIA
ncbi:rRNA processing protein Ipi1 [Aaosphaeria arxii CBS 175.79]|uniref:Pre-rRNA-processing protein n=1 Tax=Aaosphaeria arxii CBS 175.79 TaxID=1450172 RepID=A0A6A5XWW6_9PLEO|nr:rRNA processing protein Ipi1 [Aaosphaeria arxii CBS 175.79]KAF2017449.1 rRNA processing protein Ipi1 [Aaosphaeria arxii CBS 175.79]